MAIFNITNQLLQIDTGSTRTYVFNKGQSPISIYAGIGESQVPGQRYVGAANPTAANPFGAPGYFMLVYYQSTANPAPAAAPAPGAAAGVAAPAGSNASDQNEPSAADAAEKKKKDVEALKQEVAALQGEVDLAQRSLSLDQDAFYSKPDSSNDKDGKAKLDDEQADLKQKQDDLAQLKAKLAGLGAAEEPKTSTPPAKP